MMYYQQNMSTQMHVEFLLEITITMDFTVFRN